MRYYLIKALVKAIVLTTLAFAALVSVEAPETLDKFNAPSIPERILAESDCDLPEGVIPSRALVSTEDGPVWVSFEEGWEMHTTNSTHVYGFCR